MPNDDKIPSVYSYSPASNAREEQWGASLSPEAVAMVHTKLQLDVHSASEELDFILDALEGMHNLHFQHIRAGGGSEQYTWKNPEEIVEDYLVRVFDSLHRHLVETIFPEALKSRMPVDIVITVPAEWTYRAKNSTFRALTRAGFDENAFPKLTDVLLVSEPVAAAIYTARYLKEIEGVNFLRKGECFTLCDAGGGTVDVVSYRVKELEPFELEPATLATGLKCGSIFIDLAFKEWLKALLGEETYRRLDPKQLAHKLSSHNSEGRPMRQLMKTFNEKKRMFHRTQRDIRMDLPEPLHDLDMGDRVVGGEITITNENMKSFFDPCVDQIVELIRGQVKQVARLRTRLKNIFLVGGFAESEYLQEEISYSLGLNRLQLRRPDTSWTAVVRGAAIFGIEKSANKVLSTMKACPRSYGVPVSETFSKIRHHHDDVGVDPITKKPIAREQLLWLIKKGDLILSDKSEEIKQQFTKIFSPSSVRKGKLPIYSYDDDDDIPGRLSISQNDLTPVHTLEYDMTTIPLEEFTRQQPSQNSPPFYVTSLRLIMRLTVPRLEVELWWKDTKLRSANIPYL